MARSQTQHETVKLIHPVVGHKVIEEYKLRKPTAKDILPVGFPYEWQPTRDGGVVLVQNHAAIQHYAEVCMVDVDELALFPQMSIEDTIVLREKIIGFFQEAEKMRNTSVTSATGSSSDSTGDQPK